MAVIAAAHGRLDLALGGSHEVVHELAVHYGPWNRQLLQVVSGRAARTRPMYLEYSIDYCTLPTTSTQGDRRVHREQTTTLWGRNFFFCVYLADILSQTCQLLARVDILSQMCLLLA